MSVCVYYMEIFLLDLFSVVVGKINPEAILYLCYKYNLYYRIEQTNKYIVFGASILTRGEGSYY